MRYKESQKSYRRAASPQRMKVFSATSAALRCDFNSTTIDNVLGFTEVASIIQSQHSEKSLQVLCVGLPL